MKQQTSVEWYAGEKNNIVIQLRNNQITMDEYIRKDFELFDQAKEMERQQIVKAINTCDNLLIKNEIGIEANANGITLGEQYYNETYGGK